MIKRHAKDEFYVKAVKGGYFGVFDGYDNSLASLETSNEEAEKVCKKQNELRNKRLNLK